MYQSLAFHLMNAGSIVVLTGAGVSTASGIPDFRSSEGLWSEDESREFYMSTDYFRYDPRDFWKKYKAIFRMKLLKDYRPNRVHQFIKQLESDQRTINIITQNVDGLHSEAGSSNVLEYHGTLNHATCPSCDQSYSLDYIMSIKTPVCQECTTILKPDVLLFGDLITAHEQAEEIIDHADFLLVLGTSLLVTPFNMLPFYAIKQKGLPSAIINKEPTVKDNLFDYVIHDDLTTAIKQLNAQI